LSSSVQPTDYFEEYLQIYEDGTFLSPTRRNRLGAAALLIARELTGDFLRTVVLLDASWSMTMGTGRRNEPMAFAVAITRILMEAGAHRVIVGGKMVRGLTYPSGDTSLALPLARTLRDFSPRAVYVVSDGIDNTPSDRFYETVGALRTAGIETPIYHLNPTRTPAGKNTSKVRELALGKVKTLLVRNSYELVTKLNELTALEEAGDSVLKTLSGNMKKSLVELYTLPLDGRSCFNHTHIDVKPQTLRALEKRDLIKPFQPGPV
jgi:hypothetical protein